MFFTGSTREGFDWFSHDVIFCDAHSRDVSAFGSGGGVQTLPFPGVQSVVAVIDCVWPHQSELAWSFSFHDAAIVLDRCL